MAQAVTITDSNFKELVLESELLVLVDFWAKWCGPCLTMGPLVEELAEKYVREAVIGKLDIDQNPVSPTNYSIRSIPTLLFFKKGKLIDRHVGTSTKQALSEKIEKAL